MTDSPEEGDVDVKHVTKDDRKKGIYISGGLVIVCGCVMGTYTGKERITDPDTILHAVTGD